KVNREGRELDEGTHLVPSFVSRGRVGRTTRYRGSYGGISGPKCVHRSGGLARGNVRTLLQKLEPRDEVAVEEHIDGSSRLRQGSGEALGKNRIGDSFR
ncbi:hypothetical protein Tco_0148410, partial [Tanacetum coccineum]